MTPETLAQYRADALETDADDGDAMLALIREIERLGEEGVPGVMHETDRAFYKLTVKERDLERRRGDLLKVEVEFLQAQICTYPEAKLCICPHFRGTP